MPKIGAMDNRTLLFLMLLVGAGFALASPRARASEGAAAPVASAPVLKVHVKSAMESTQEVTRLRAARAPFQPLPGDPAPTLVSQPEDPRYEESRSSCSKNSNALCYDRSSGRLVYKKTAQYMPEILGMKAESISVRRSRVTFKYSFR